MSIVCSQEVTACYTSASVANRLRVRSFIRGWKRWMSLGGRVGCVEGGLPFQSQLQNNSQVWSSIKDLASWRKMTIPWRSKPVLPTITSQVYRNNLLAVREATQSGNFTKKTTLWYQKTWHYVSLCMELLWNDKFPMSWVLVWFRVVHC